MEPTKTQAPQGSKRLGRPPLPPELSGKNGGKRRKRWMGMRADYSRALITQLAYDLRVPATGSAIQRACNKLNAEASGIKELAEEAVSRWNRWQAYLQAKSLVPPPQKEWLIETRSRELALLGRNDFWIVYEKQPTGGFEFRSRINDLIRIAPPIIVRPRAAFVVPSPDSPLMHAIDRQDSLKSLAAAILTYGMANEQFAYETCEAAFARALRILCRVACVAPFAGFGDEFVANVIGSMVTNWHYVPMDWRTVSRKRMGEYRHVIRHGRESGFLTCDENHPQGRNNEELAALRLADEVGHLRLHAAFDAFARNNKRLPVLCKRLRSRSKSAASNLYI